MLQLYSSVKPWEVYLEQETRMLCELEGMQHVATQLLY